MTSDPSPEALAGEFWSGTGLGEIFPRNVEKAIAMKLPLALVKMPLLNADVVRKWLERRQAAAPLPMDHRDLIGCLVAHRGHGIIFVCGIEEPGELRLTVAHEAAHFLVDYLLPRQHMINALGNRIAEVLDGLRPAAHEERVHAILSHVRLGPHVHLLPRADTDEDSDAFAAHTEDRADRLALELLAPRERVISLLHNLPAGETLSANEASAALAAYFGLPVHACEWIIQQMSRHRPASFLADALLAIRGR